MDCLKKQLRRQLQEKRRQVGLHTQEISAQAISTQLFQRSYFRQARHIALYMAFQGEVCTRKILEKAFSLQQFCYLPAIESNQMHFVRVKPDTTLVKNRFGILEPPFCANHLIEPAALDLVLVPLVAFDKDCHRLGMGGGFYDKTFTFKRRHTTKPKLIGLAYDFQRVALIPRSNLDVLLDEVITEKKIYIAT